MRHTWRRPGLTVGGAAHMIAPLFPLLATGYAPAATTRHAYTPGQAAMEITALPGAPAVAWKQFGGYVDVGARGQIFFWLVESQSATPAADPLLLWTNGGPGCSGLTGFMTEHGPFRPTPDGTLELNKYAWNLAANMVYIEQPVGVGFSQATGKLEYDDALAAKDNLAFVKGFLETFPQFKTNKFFITSESYGGHYMPTLAAAIVADGGVPSFGGFMVGNPLTYLSYRNYGEFGTYYGHQLLPKPLWEEYEKAECATAAGLDPGAACEAIEANMSKITAGFDPYGLDFPKCNDSALASGRHERHSMRRTIARANFAARHPEASSPSSSSSSAPYPYFPADYQPCTSDWATAYLSRADVQAAIHAKTPQSASGNWSACSDAVGSVYSASDTAASMVPVYRGLLNSSASRAGALKMLIYSGDDDAVCATRGTQQFIWEMGLPLKPGRAAWAPWKMASGPGCPNGPACEQIAGFGTVWEGLSFVTVHGAGHLVPSTRPAAALRLLQDFLAGVW